MRACVFLWLRGGVGLLMYLLNLYSRDRRKCATVCGLLYLHPPNMHCKKIIKKIHHYVRNKHKNGKYEVWKDNLTWQAKEKKGQKEAALKPRFFTNVVTSSSAWILCFYELINSTRSPILRKLLNTLCKTQQSVPINQEVERREGAVLFRECSVFAQNCWYNL